MRILAKSQAQCPVAMRGILNDNQSLSGDSADNNCSAPEMHRP